MNNLIQFIKEAYEELKKVSWLTRQQMIASTWLVIWIVIVFAVYVGFIDFVIVRTFSYLI